MRRPARQRDGPVDTNFTYNAHDNVMTCLTRFNDSAASRLTRTNSCHIASFGMSRRGGLHAKPENRGSDCRYLHHNKESTVLNQPHRTASHSRRTLHRTTALALSALFLTALPPTDAAASSRRTLPPTDVCAQDISVIPATYVHTQFHLQNLGGQLVNVDLTCGTQVAYGLRHIDYGHSPATGDLDVVSLLICINQVAGTRRPVLSQGNWLYERIDTQGTWRVVVNPNPPRTVTTAYRVGWGLEHDPFYNCRR